MKAAIQRFGAAMFVPVLLFPAAGMLLGVSVMLLNQNLFPWAVEGSFWFNISQILLQASLAVFKNMPLVFALGMPIALAKKASGRAVLATFVSYITFNYIIGGILQFWGTELGVNYTPGQTGLTEIGGILTLDTNLLGSIAIASLSVWIHNRFFDRKLSDWASVFSGTPLVIIISFPLMVMMAILTCFTWPSIQAAITSLQTGILNAGTLGVWGFAFLERLLIPTGLHHFVYGPVFYGPVAVDAGTIAHWIQNIPIYAANPAPLAEQFPQGGLMLTGMGKVFGCIGIAAALYSTAKDSQKKMVMGLVLGAAITAALTGITEPIEFTFLFLAPVLFVLHALLAATMAALTFAFGISGNFQTGLIDFLFQNWLPLFDNHGALYLVQIIIGLLFVGIYFITFRTLIIKCNIMTPGRDDSEAKLTTKEEYKNRQQQAEATTELVASVEGIDNTKALAMIEGIGGQDNIIQLTNCATRLRVTVRDADKVRETSFFQKHGAVNVVRNGDTLQIIIGLTVPQLKEEMSLILARMVYHPI